MFKKDNRYVTREVNEEVDIRLQLIMWSMLDKLNDEGNVELDYLQVFRIRKEGNKIVISQSQEVPKYSCTYEMEIEDIQLYDEIKVYVIDSGEYSTMLFLMNISICLNILKGGDEDEYCKDIKDTWNSYYSYSCRYRWKQLREFWIFIGDFTRENHIYNQHYKKS